MRGADAQGPAPLRLLLPSPGLEGLDALTLQAVNTGAEPLLAGLYLWYARPGQPPLAFSGGRAWLGPGLQGALLFGREDFGSYGDAGLWERVRWLELVLAREKGSGPGLASVSLGQLCGQRRLSPHGPRLTPRALEGLLSTQADTDPVALAPDGPACPPPHQFPRSTAEELLAGKVLGQEIGFPWDWDADPLKALEWRHFLHRHHDLRTLALAWAQTRRRACLLGLGRLLEDWIHRHPVPVESNGGAGPAWETLSAAWRVLEWARIRPLAWDGLGARLRGLWRRSLWEHGRHLADHQGHPNNWAIVEAAALALAGLAWPEFAEAPAWRALGLDRLARQCQGQFALGGALRELSPLYQAVCLEALLIARGFCQLAGHAWPRQAEQALLQGTEHLASLARPDYSWPSLNDSGGARGDYTALLAWAGHDLDRPAWRWLGSRGRRGQKPPARHGHAPGAGLVVLRGGQGAEGPWALLRGAPPTLTHGHQDALSLEVFWAGLRVVDPGISTYAPGPLTTLYRQADAHSQPLLDGQGALCGAGHTGLWRRPGLGLAMARGGTPAGAELSRWVLMVADCYCLVWDRAWGLEGEHCLQVGWQLFPASWRRRGRSLEAADGFGLHMLSAPATARLDLARGRRRPARGWVSLEGVDTTAPHWRLRARGEMPLQALWLLAPGPAWRLAELRQDQDQTALVLAHPAGPVHRLALRPAASPPVLFRAGRRSGPGSCP